MIKKKINNSPKIELNELFLKALNIMENTTNNIFITGKAGTGKSTLLDYFRNTTQKKIVVLAPTGVAAINVKGETIHSFFGFKPDITVDKVKKISSRSGNKTSIYKKIQAIVIDEISMVRADLLDCVDRFLRLNGNDHNLSFGGVQMIFIGDLYQLPPVVTGKEKEIFTNYYKSQYFFSAKIFENFAMEYLELEKVYRQKDEKFIDLLNCIRNNTASEEEFNLINSRYNPDFESKGNYYIYLTTTNKMATEINEKQLEKLKDKYRIFNGEIEGDFEENYLPTDLQLKLKKSAQIMLLNNDSQGRWVNGTIGKIIDFEKEIIVVELENGNLEEVEPHTWEIFHFQFNAVTNNLESQIIGSFTQYPLKLAWAITIHKSQGKTFAKVIIDIGRGTFAHGQMYVALSRATSLEGIILKKKIKKNNIFMDYRIRDFVTKYQYKISEQNCPLENKIEIISKAIKNKTNLEIVYLKTKDEKTKRLIAPMFVGKMEYLGKKYLGVSAYCFKRETERIFRVDRILELKEESK